MLGSARTDSSLTKFLLFWMDRSAQTRGRLSYSGLWTSCRYLGARAAHALHHGAYTLITTSLSRLALRKAACWSRFRMWYTPSSPFSGSNGGGGGGSSSSTSLSLPILLLLLLLLLL
jgi:hypothetical protein